MISNEIKGNCTIVRVTGEVTANEIIMEATRYLSGEQTDTVLWDFTQTERLKITTVEVRGIAESLKGVGSDGKIRKVALVSSKTLNIGLGKVFAAFAQMAGLPREYKVFRSIDLAEQWLAGKAE